MASIASTIGALEIGILLSTALYGVATVQAYVYTERSFKDPMWLHSMVLLVWVSETIHTVFTWILLYWLTVANYGIPSAITKTHWSLAMTVPLASCVGASVQVFFAWRVRILGGNLIVPIIVWAGAVLRVAFGITVGAVLITSKLVSSFFVHYQWLVDTLLILNSTVDFLNTISLCYYLLRRRSDFKTTRRVVDKLMLYTIETGLLTSLCALAVLACSLAMRQNLIFLSIFMVYPKLFSNSFFTSLNTRESLRQNITKSVRSDELHPDSMHLSDIGYISKRGQTPLPGHTQIAHLPARASSPAFTDIFGKETFS